MNSVNHGALQLLARLWPATLFPDNKGTHYQINRVSCRYTKTYGTLLDINPHLVANCMPALKLMRTPHTSLTSGRATQFPKRVLTTL